MKYKNIYGKQINVDSKKLKAGGILKTDKETTEIKNLIREHYLEKVKVVNKKKYKTVEVIWFDAQSSMESFTVKEIEDVLKPLKTKSVGYLLIERKKYIVLGFCDFGNGLIKHHQCIPRGMIENIKVIK